MRIVHYAFILSLLPCLGFSQNKITGKVVDQLGFPIYRASIAINSTDDMTFSDYDGSFTLSSNKDFHWKINVESQGYKPESFFVLNGGNAGSIKLQYDADLRKLLDGNSSLEPKFYWDAWERNILFPSSENLVAGIFE